MNQAMLNKIFPSKVKISSKVNFRCLEDYGITFNESMRARALFNYPEQVNKAIQEACSIDEIKLIRDKAEAFRYTLIQAKVSPKYMRMAEIHKLRAEYKAGELLKEQARRPGEYPRKQTSELMRFAPTLSDMEITYNQSSNWQLISTIPKEDEFENYLQTSKEITTSGAVNLANKIKKTVWSNRPLKGYKKISYQE
jgi:hypothetical protein